MFKLLLSKLFPSLASGFAGGLLNQVFGLTKAERQQNQYNAFEAQKQRDWSAMQAENANAFAAAEAQKTRDFQADQAATQYQRGVKDMQSAGLNPALAYGQGGASAMQGATASPSMPSGEAATGSGRGVPVSLSDIMQSALMAKQVEKTEAEIGETEARTENLQTQSKYVGLEIASYNKITDTQIRQIEQAIQTSQAEKRLKESGIHVNEAEAALKAKQAILTGIDAESRAQLNKLEAQLRMAQVGLTYANTAETRKRIEFYQAEITELLQRAVTEGAQARLYDQEATNLLVQEGILHYDEETKAYAASKKKLTYTLDCIGKVVGAISQTASIGASVAGGLGALRGASALSGMSAVMQNVGNLHTPGLKYAPANSFNPYSFAR